MALGTLELLNGANGHSRPTSVVEPKAPMAAIVEHGLGADLDAKKIKITLTDNLKPIPPPESLIFGQVCPSALLYIHKL